LHDTEKRNFPHLDGEVDVVCHQAEGVDVIAELLHTFLQKKAHTITVVILEEDVLLRVSSQDNVIKGTGEVYARFASHGRTLQKLKHESNPVPLSFLGLMPFGLPAVCESANVTGACNVSC